ncbi:hypothetical protein BKA81DRAFT_406218 [Phyllosticta paracitricarpa]|uniref:Uncharacterized protein n=1 Tax=Phyllosticta paracitricarpa TaxID=2016321 RepID=A0ABR1NDR0_9PEZI
MASASSRGGDMTSTSNALPNELMPNNDGSASSPEPSEKSPPASPIFQDKDDRGFSEERSSAPKELAEDAGGSEYRESADEHSEHSNSEEEHSDWESESRVATSKNRTRIKYGPDHNAGLPVTGASHQSTAGQSDGHLDGLSVAGSSTQNAADRNDGQNDEEEILLGRDTPQHVRCLPWRTKSRIPKRTLITWDVEMYTHSLLSLLWVMETYDYPIPWPELAAIVNPGATGEAFKQAMVKLRNRRLTEGLKVPPPRPSKDHPRHQCKLELAEMMRAAEMNPDPTIPEYGSGVLRTTDNPYVAELRESTSHTDARRPAQRSNRKMSSPTSRLSQCDSEYESLVLEDSQDFSVIHSRSPTSTPQSSHPAITTSPERRLIFVAHIGPEKCIATSNRPEQKLVSDVANNVVKGRFAKPSGHNLIFFLDTVPSQLSTEDLESFPEKLSPETTMARPKKGSTKKAQQKRKRSVTSSGSPLQSPTSPLTSPGPLITFDLHHTKRSKQHEGKADAGPSCLFPEQRELASDPHKKHSKLNEGNADAGQDYPVPEPREPVPGTKTSYSRKRKVDDTDLGEIDPAAEAEEMFNRAYATPMDMSFRPPPFVDLSDLGMSSRQNLNIGLSYSPTRQPHGHMDSSFDSNMMKASSKQSMASMSELDMDMNLDMNASADTGIEIGMGMGMSSASFNYADQLGRHQDAGYRFGYEGPFMGACSNLDLTLDSVTSEQEMALLSSTSEWRSSASAFDGCPTERRLGGLPPFPCDSDHAHLDQHGQAFKYEHLRHKDRGMLNDNTLKEPAFDPNAYADEEFARIDWRDNSEQPDS